MRYCDKCARENGVMPADKAKIGTCDVCLKIARVTVVPD